MGLIHLDAGVVIGLLDRDDAHHEAVRSVLTRALDGGERIAMAASALAECLVGPARQGAAAVATVLDLFRRLPIAVVSLDEEIAVAAARLRAQHRSLRLPDALVIATAEVEHADRLITTDRRWPTQQALGLRTTLEFV